MAILLYNIVPLSTKTAPIRIGVVSPELGSYSSLRSPCLLQQAEIFFDGAVYGRDAQKFDEIDAPFAHPAFLVPQPSVVDEIHA